LLLTGSVSVPGANTLLFTPACAWATDIRVPGSGGGLIQGLFMGIGILFAVLGVLLVAAAIAIGI